MRILFVSDNFPPETNAPASRLYEHAVEWVKAGHQVTVITCAPNFPGGVVFEGYSNRLRHIELIEGIRVVRVKTYITANEGFLKRTLDYVSFMAMSVIMGLLEPRPDVVVATSPQFFSAVGGWLLSVLKWRPFVFEVRDLWPATIIAVGAIKNRQLLGILEQMELFLYRRAAAVVLVTEAFRDDLIARDIDPRKLSVVPNGVDMSQFAPAPRDPDLMARYDIKGKFVVGYLGTHGLCHALESIVEVATRLVHREDIVFMFVGAGAARAVVDDMVAARVMPNVRLIPAQPKSAMPAHWGLCDVALVPLKNDPVFRTVLPSKIFECMGMGLPMLVSVPTGEATGIVLAHSAGVVAEPENVDQISAAIERLADDRPTLELLGAAALAAAPKFSRASMARNMLQVLQAAASGTLIPTFRDGQNR